MISGLSFLSLISFAITFFNSTMSLKSVEYLSVGMPFLNSAGGDSLMLVDKFNIGINVNEKDPAESAFEILKINKETLLKMHRNCIELYNSKFTSRNLDDVLKDVL